MLTLGVFQGIVYLRIWLIEVPHPCIEVCLVLCDNKTIPFFFSKPVIVVELYDEIRCVTSQDELLVMLFDIRSPGAAFLILPEVCCKSTIIEFQSHVALQM